jgi:hypothetical protein
MRLCFGELSAEEATARALVVARGVELWRCVVEGDDARACALVEQLDSRLALYVQRDAGGDDSTVELSPLEPSAWPLGRLLLAQAPRDLGLTLSLGRVAVPIELALEEVEQAHGVALGRASLRAGFGRGHLLEITLGVPGGNGSEIEQIAAESLVRAVLGDRLFETWVGAVHSSVEPRLGSLRVLDVRAPRSKLQVQELFDTVAAATHGVLSGLPDRSHAERAQAGTEPEAEWAMLEVEPMQDAAGGRKEDLVLASTSTPELLRCFLDDAPCASRRFSRLGESFVYVSYADELTNMKQRLARRAELEAALARGLAAEGAVTGVGLGVHTSYLDLALCNLETGLERLVSILREHGAPRDSIVQFFDSELSEEWLSIWPDSQLLER